LDVIVTLNFQNNSDIPGDISVCIVAAPSEGIFGSIEKIITNKKFLHGLIMI